MFFFTFIPHKSCQKLSKKILFIEKYLFRNAKFEAKNPYFTEFKSKIKIFSIHNFFCWKYAAASRKNCSFLSSHDVADGRYGRRNLSRSYNALHAAASNKTKAFFLKCSKVMFCRRISTGRLFHSRVRSSCREGPVTNRRLLAARHTCRRRKT